MNGNDVNDDQNNSNRIKSKNSMWIYSTWNKQFLSSISRAMCSDVAFS